VQTQEYFRGAFLEWIDAIKVNKATCRDHFFIDANNQQSPTAYLMGFLSNSKEILPEAYDWIVADYPELIGKNAEPTYQNAVRVVNARRRQ
jgi:hypothetical protein